MIRKHIWYYYSGFSRWVIHVDLEVCVSFLEYSVLKYQLDTVASSVIHVSVPTEFLSTRSISHWQKRAEVSKYRVDLFISLSAFSGFVSYILKLFSYMQAHPELLYFLGELTFNEYAVSYLILGKFVCSGVYFVWY